MIPSTIELLVECLDALKAPSLDPEHRGAHVEHLDRALADPALAPALGDLFAVTTQAIGALRNMHLFEPTPTWVMDLICRLEGELRDRAVPRYLYHGTVAGRVAPIRLNGLVPGGAKVWTHRKDLRRRGDGAVFFTDTWRGAVSWAMVAHLKTRGPRTGPFRRPVVIRVPASDLAAVRDELAMPPGCWAIRGRVPVSDARMIEAPLEGFPEWKPLALPPHRARVER